MCLPFYYMKKIVRCFLFVLLIASCNTMPQRECSKFKTGSFTFASTIEGEERTTTFSRNDKIEIEEFNGVKDTATIRWINDCEYILKKINPKSRAEEKSIYIKILTTSDSSYTFEYNAVGSPQKFKGEAFKIH